MQRQISNSTSVEVAYVGNKGTHIFAGDGPTYNVNQPRVGAGVDIGGAYVPNVPLNYRRPYFNAFTYSGYADPTNTAANLPGAPNQVPGVLQCCSTDQSNYLGNDASSEYNARSPRMAQIFEV